MKNFFFVQKCFLSVQITTTSSSFFLYLFGLHDVQLITTTRLQHKFCGTTFRRGKAMRLHDFIHLPESEKARLLYKHGVYIGKRRHGTISVVLYQLDGFYAEVFYRSYRREIDHISCFSGTARLDPYLTEINVEHLVM